jgi:aspartate aminotransferase
LEEKLMNTLVSKAVSSMTPSLTLALSAKANELKAQGIDVCGFTAGEPDFDTPEFIRKAAIGELEKGGKVCKYTPASGLPELKKAVVSKFKRENGLDFEIPQVTVAGGAKQLVAQAILCLTDPGSEVIISSPFWLSYPEMARSAGAVPVVIDCSTNENFAPTADQIRSAITEKTRVLILNSPGNPTGGVFDRSQFEAIYKVVEGTDIAVVSDEIYEHLIYDGKQHYSPAGLSEDAYNRTVTINGASKGYAMTGWRIGYAGGPAAMIKAMNTFQSHYTSGPATVSQMATIAALEGGLGEVERMRGEFDKRRKIMVEGLNAMDGVECTMPHGAFYCFPKVSALYRDEIKDSLAFSEALLEKEAVVVVPGKAFGADEFVRLSYACSTEQIEKGLERIARFVKGAR